MTGLRLRNKRNHNTSMVLNFGFSLRCKYVKFMLILINKRAKQLVHIAYVFYGLIIFALMSLIFKFVPVKR